MTWCDLQVVVDDRNAMYKDVKVTDNCSPVFKLLDVYNHVFLHPKFWARNDKSESSSRAVGEKDAGRTAYSTDWTESDNQERKQGQMERKKPNEAAECRVHNSKKLRLVSEELAGQVQKKTL